MGDAELVEFASDFREGLLQGEQSRFYCIMICAPLSALLAFHGVENDVDEWKTDDENHVWITLPDGRILDPTADQWNDERGYSFPPVYLGPPLPIHAPLPPQEMRTE